MSAPHADRDHSEQPCCGDHNHEPCRGCPDGRDAGTSRSVSARVVRASEAQVVAALDVLGCGAYQNRRGVVVCIHERHEHYGAWSERGCPVAAAVADAVVAAGDADEVTRLRADLALYKRGGKTLGEIIDWQCRAALDATGMHHLIDEDGDGDWALVWEHLAELRPRAEAAEAERDALRETVAKLRWAAALSGPSPAQTPATATEPAPRAAGDAEGQSGTGEALGGAEKRCRVCTGGWFGARFHNLPFSCHYHCECGTPCRACAVGHGFHRSSPHKPAEHDACGCAAEIDPEEGDHE